MAYRQLFMASLLGITAISTGWAAAAAEVQPVKSLPCFPGAYYRKAVSSLDHWSGIEAVVQLPEPDYDMDRMKPNGRPLDNASLYLGGNAGDQEIDCGVSWEVVKEADGTISKTGKAFRPFTRNNAWKSGPAQPEYYYYPGDVIRMKVENTQDGKLMMRIDLLARAKDASALPAPAEQADETTNIVAHKQLDTDEKSIPVSSNPVDALSSYTEVFDAKEFRVDGLKQFKRVNGMDQSGNEGKTVQPTNSKISNAAWREVWLLRGPKRLPMTAERYTDMRCPDPKHISVSPAGLSGETVTLSGNPQN